MPYDLEAFRQNASGARKKIPPKAIIAWIEKNFEYKTRKNDSEYLINNPFSGDTNFKFNINPESGLAHCWTDGDTWAGPVNPVTGKRNCSFLQFVKLYRKCSYLEAVLDVLGTGGDAASYLRPERRTDGETAQRTIAVALPDGVEPLLPKCGVDIQASILANWLESRGYTTEQIGKSDIHYSGLDIYWPYYEFDSLVYWQSRNRVNKIFRFPDTTVRDDEGNIIGITEGSKTDFWYGFDAVEPATYVTITESIFGQNTLGEQALASGGAIFGDPQIQKLRILGPKKGVILAPDNDKAGILSILTNAPKLQAIGFKVLYSIPPKLPYKTGDGETKFVKDWNELVQKCKMSLSEARRIHDDLIRPMNPREVFKLRGMIKSGR